jgi:competence protein ComEC
VGVFAPPVGRTIAFLAMVPMRYLELVADRLAKAPVPWVTSGGGLAPLLGGSLLVGGLAWWLRSNRRVPRAAVAGAALLLPLFVWSSALSAGPPAGLVVRFFDVGQGDAALVSSPDGANVLIDAGPDEELVATRLAALGVKRLDIVVATHPHADHVAGFPAVLARFPVGIVLDPGCDEPSPAYTEFLRAVADEHLPVRHPRAGDGFSAGGLRLEVLGPSACAEGTDSDPNNDSLVIRLSYGEDIVLLPGDAEEPLQQEILDAGESVAAEVLKVPHHGGATSLEGFFEAVDAELAVVSVGPNDYGHTVPEILD